MKLTIPLTFMPDQQKYLRDFSVAVEKSVGLAQTKGEVLEEILLASPSRKIYRVVVGDDGTLSTQLVQE